MHGARHDLPVTCIEHISLPNQRAFSNTLGDFATQLDTQDYSDPLLILVGIDSAAGKAVTATAPEAQVEVAHG